MNFQAVNLSRRCVRLFMMMTTILLMSGCLCFVPSRVTFQSITFKRIHRHQSLVDGISEKERTLALIKPDGVKGNFTDQIKNAIKQSGFSVLKERALHLDEGLAAKFYSEHSSKSFFPSLVKYMTSGPIVALVLEKKDAIGDWRYLIGPTDARIAKVTHPTSIRALCGIDLEKNCVHGSDSAQSAEREISFFFENLSTGKNSFEHDEL